MNIYPVINKACLSVSKNKRVLFYMAFFFSPFKSIYLKYLKYLQSGPKFELIMSNDMWPHVSRYEVGSYFSYFLVTYLAHIYIFLNLALVHLLRGWEYVGIYCKFIPNWIKLTQAIILFPAQYITKLEILLGEVFRK